MGCGQAGSNLAQYGYELPGFNWGQNNVDLRTEKVPHFEKLEGK
jgi:hypothetical protein